MIDPIDRCQQHYSSLPANNSKWWRTWTFFFRPVPSLTRLKALLSPASGGLHQTGIRYRSPEGELSDSLMDTFPPGINVYYGMGTFSSDASLTDASWGKCPESKLWIWTTCPEGPLWINCALCFKPHSLLWNSCNHDATRLNCFGVWNNKAAGYNLTHNTHLSGFLSQCMTQMVTSSKLCDTFSSPGEHAAVQMHHRWQMRRTYWRPRLTRSEGTLKSSRHLFPPCRTPGPRPMPK